MFNYRFRDILRLITAIRDSTPDSRYIYKNGGCYKFALILKTMFDGEIYYSQILGHVWFKYKGKFFDIDGMTHKPPVGIEPLDHVYGHRPHRWRYRITLASIFNMLSDYKCLASRDTKSEMVTKREYVSLHKLCDSLHNVYIQLETEPIITATKENTLEGI